MPAKLKARIRAFVMGNKILPLSLHVNALPVSLGDSGTKIFKRILTTVLLLLTKNLLGLYCLATVLLLVSQEPCTQQFLSCCK